MMDHASRVKALFYPDIVNVKNAIDAANKASAWALIVSAVTGTVGIYAVFYHPIFGLDAYALVDAALMGIVSWRIREFSKAWSIVGLCYWIVSLIYRLLTTFSSDSSASMISIFVLFGFVNGVRGVFGFHKFTKRPEWA